MSKSNKSTMWEFLQSLGKTFMLPVALLAFSGILLGVGSLVLAGVQLKSQRPVGAVDVL